ncbi:unnamed protein product [Penicillium salamii]|uniref:Protein kinase domain-containing protein n=1 Tax=Penicillium salamii TaxID=1612424 RepID=A0A9W4J1X5_9EURO|nr:unnamed protein product [Penicillium salamii]
MKVSTCHKIRPTATYCESKIYEHLTKIDSSHPGQSLIREVFDSFELQSEAEKHQCLILQPMHMTLLEMMRLNPKPFDLPLLKMTLKRQLLALDFLHTEANIIHTNIKTDNLMLTLEDDTMLADFAHAEYSQPGARKRKSYGLPVLCDLGEARIGKTHQSGPFVQPNIYRAPEIIFEMPWGSAVDIWNLGALVNLMWDFFEGNHLFGDIFDSNGNHDPFKHLALMVALIGPPPAEFVRRSETTEQCFDRNAHEHAPIPCTSLESLEKRLSGTKKECFLLFLGSMLKWLPEERKTVKQLLDDPWLL